MPPTSSVVVEKSNIKRTKILQDAKPIADNLGADMFDNGRANQILRNYLPAMMAL